MARRSEADQIEPHRASAVKDLDLAVHRPREFRERSLRSIELVRSGQIGDEARRALDVQNHPAWDPQACAAMFQSSLGVGGDHLMAVYIVSDAGPVADEDQPAWQAYLKIVPATIERYGGRYLARGGSIDVLEGDWSPYAIVLVEFPDRDAAMSWYGSPEYAEGLRIRAGSGLHRRLVCVEGVRNGEAGWAQPGSHTGSP